ERLNGSEYFHEDRYGSHEGLLKYAFLSDQESVLFECRFKGAAQLRQGARLCQESKNVTLINCRDCCFEVSLSRQENANSTRGDLSNFGKQFDSARSRHLKIRDDDSVVVLSDRFESVLWPGGNFDGICPTEGPLEAGYDVKVVIDNQN